MPRPRFERLEPEVQDRILDAAAAEFAEHGALAASFNRIIAAAGISKGAIYYYFDDKEDLFLTVVRRAGLRLRGRVGGVAVGDWPDAPYWDAIHGLIADTWAAALDTPEALPLMKAALALGIDPTRSRATADFLDEMHAWIGEILEHGQRVGAVRTDQPVALLAQLVGAAGQALDLWMLGEVDGAARRVDEARLQACVALYVDVFRRIAAP